MSNIVDHILKSAQVPENLKFMQTAQNHIMENMNNNSRIQDLDILHKRKLISSDVTIIPNVVVPEDTSASKVSA